MAKQCLVRPRTKGDGQADPHRTTKTILKAVGCSTLAMLGITWRALKRLPADLLVSGQNLRRHAWKVGLFREMSFALRKPHTYKVGKRHVPSTLVQVDVSRV